METLEFFKKFDQDEELQKKFKEVKGPEDFYKIACENGLTDDFETMKSVGAEEMKKNADVSENDLGKLAEVSGGDADTVAVTIEVSALSTGLVTSYIISYSGSAAAGAAV